MHLKPYTHGEFRLYARDVELRNGNGTQRIYFFSKHEPKSGVPANLPRGYRVQVSDRTGLPLLKKDPTANAGFMDNLKRYFN